MPTGVVTWSQNASQNDVADSGVNWREGQAPSSVNDSARAGMASVAKWRDDIAGTVLVTGGTSTAYSLNTNQVFAGNNNGNTVQFTPGVTNTGAVTLATDGQTPLPLRFLTGVDLPAGVTISGSLYQATLRAGEWLLHSQPQTGAPFLIPLGGLIDYTGATAPNSNFVLPQGQAISRSTYATYFALVGTSYGGGDGSTTFNVPDLVGRITAMQDGSSARLSSSYFGGNPAQLGAVGGSESTTLINNNLPAYTPAGSLSLSTPVSTSVTTTGTASVTSANWVANNTNDSTAQSVTNNGATVGVSITSAAGAQVTKIASSGAISASSSATSTATPTGSFSGSAQGGVSAPFRTVQPTIILNKLLRVL